MTAAEQAALARQEKAVAAIVRSLAADRALSRSEVAYLHRTYGGELEAVAARLRQQAEEGAR